MNVIISCSGKFHAFALAEQMQRFGLLKTFYTTYSSKKNRILKTLVGRIDKESIEPKRIKMFLLLGIAMKISPKNSFFWNELFDKWVASNLRPIENGIFIGWSGMSYHSILKAKNLGYKTILERGSAHIEYQNEILKEEYQKFGINYSIDKRVIEKELKEYELVDYISIPSTFVKNSFINKKISENKLLLNCYGSSEFFKLSNTHPRKTFTILYLGSLTIQKGVKYLFEALQLLEIPPEDFEVWFVGKKSVEISAVIDRFKRGNWIFFGHINHYELPQLISKCHIAIQPSLQDGFGMVINQTLACGLPTIATTNTGGPDIITDFVNGFVIPIRSPTAIAEKVDLLYKNRALLDSMRINALKTIGGGFSWNDYGDRYHNFLKGVND